MIGEFGRVPGRAGGGEIGGCGHHMGLDAAQAPRAERTVGQVGDPSARSKPSATMSTRASDRSRSISTSGCAVRNRAMSGAMLAIPKPSGAATRMRPASPLPPSRAASSAASASAKIRAARSASGLPASVRASRREVRWNRAWPSRASSRAITFDTVALLTPSRSAAALNERASTTAANTAQASRSGSGMARSS
jgi:hypothetical protein